MSDLAAVQDQIKWGLPSDCDTNPLCSGALKDYGINYPPKQRTALGACDVPMAQALQGKAIDLAELCSTQPAIAQFGFVSLDDDKETQPAENIAPIVRDDYLAKVDKAAFQALLDAASAKVTTEALTKMGVDVAVEQQGRRRSRQGLPRRSGPVTPDSSLDRSKPVRSPDGLLAARPAERAPMTVVLTGRAISIPRRGRPRRPRRRARRARRRRPRAGWTQTHGDRPRGRSRAARPIYGTTTGGRRPEAGRRRGRRGRRATRRGCSPTTSSARVRTRRRTSSGRRCSASPTTSPRARRASGRSSPSA